MAEKPEQPMPAPVIDETWSDEPSELRGFLRGADHGPEENGEKLHGNNGFPETTNLPQWPSSFPRRERLHRAPKEK